MNNNETDIWQEGADPRECEDCGHTSHSCTCYEKECNQCTKVVDPADYKILNGAFYCDDLCIELFLNE